MKKENENTLKSWIYCTLAAVAIYSTVNFGYYNKIDQELSQMPLDQRVKEATQFLDHWNNSAGPIEKFKTAGMYFAAKKIFR